MYPQHKVGIEPARDDGSASAKRIGARVRGMGNIGELSINVVKVKSQSR